MSSITTPKNSNVLLTEPEAAAVLRIAPTTLRDRRLRDRSRPRHVKVGALVRYRRQDIDEYLALNTKDAA